MTILEGCYRLWLACQTWGRIIRNIYEQKKEVNFEPGFESLDHF